MATVDIKGLTAAAAGEMPAILNYVDCITVHRFYGLQWTAIILYLFPVTILTDMKTSLSCSIHGLFQCVYSGTFY